MQVGPIGRAYTPLTDTTERASEQTSCTTTNPLGRGLAAAFIKKLSDVETYCTAPTAFLHHLLRAPKFLLSAIPRWIGGKIQGGYDSQSCGVAKARYALGACFVGLGNLCGGLIGLVEGLIDLCILGCVERALRAIFAVAVIMCGAIKSGCTFSRASFDSSISFAKQIIAPNFKKMNYEVNGVVDRALVEQHMIYSCIASSYSRREFSPYNLQYLSKHGYVPLNCGALPESILARVKAEQIEHGTKLKLRNSGETSNVPIFRTDAWADLGVTFFERNVSGEPKKCIINFGYAAITPGSQKTIIATGVGIVDSAFHEGDALVKAMVEKYGGAENVIVLGTSKGGGIAAYAAMKNGARAYGFNAMGLNQTHLRSLGDDLTNQDKVTQIYTMNDWLYPILTITPLTLVGKHYQIPGSEKDGHFYCMPALNRYFRGLPVPRDVATEAQTGQNAGLYGSVGYHYAT